MYTDMLPRLRHRWDFLASKQKTAIIAPFGEGMQRAGLGVLIVFFALCRLNDWTNIIFEGL